MYKVFIYDKPVFIHKKQEKSRSYEQLKSASDVDEIIHLLEQEDVVGIEITNKNPLQEWNSFKKHFKIILAAGGVVFNNKKELLVIHRIGKWDLPKGKLEKGEEISSCAIREVEEECGVGDLKIIKELTSTFHCYKTRKGIWVLKRTYWFEMKTSYSDKLIPQLEEGIDAVEWAASERVSEIKKNTYNSINEVMDLIPFKKGK